MEILSNIELTGCR